MYQFTAQPDQIDATAEHYQTAISRAYGSNPAFRGALLFADRGSGEMLSVALFSSVEAVAETAARSAEEALRGSVVAGADAVPVGRQFEVIAQVR